MVFSSAAVDQHVLLPAEDGLALSEKMACQCLNALLKQCVLEALRLLKASKMVDRKPAKPLYTAIWQSGTVMGVSNTLSGSR